jgi:hypothetical protein
MSRNSITRIASAAAAATLAAGTVALGACVHAGDTGRAFTGAVAHDVPPPAAPQSVAGNLVVGHDAAFVSWLEPKQGDGFLFRFSRWQGTAWSAPLTIADGARIVADDANPPTLFSHPDGSLLAEWVVRSEDGTGGLEIQVAGSDDGGKTWLTPSTLLRDNGSEGIGHVSFVERFGDGVGAVWLQSVQSLPWAKPRLSLEFAAWGKKGNKSHQMVDPHVTDCGGTHSATVYDGTIVAYRKEAYEEGMNQGTRDIAVIRLVSGDFIPRVVYHDGWRPEGCVQGGPALDARDRRVVLAWYTASQNNPRIDAAFSLDGGRSFGPPVHVTEDLPTGPVDVSINDDKSSFLAWSRDAAQSGSLVVRAMDPDGVQGATITAATLPAGTSVKNLRLGHSGNRLFVQWNDDSNGGHVHVAAVELPAADLRQPK